MGDLSDLTRQLGVMGGAGAAVFGDRLDHGQDVDQSHLDNIQGILDRLKGADRSLRPLRHPRNAARRYRGPLQALATVTVPDKASPFRDDDTGLPMLKKGFGFVL